MGEVVNFEDLIAWQRARALARRVYEITREPRFARDFGLCGQMQRAAVSTMSNIAEGNERGSTKEYHRFLCIAKASCAEVRSQLYVALDADHIDRGTFEELLSMAQEVGRLVGGLRRAVGSQRLAQAESS